MVLSHQHHRDVQPSQLLFVLRGENGGQQDDARHLVGAEQIQVLQLLFLVVVRVGQQEQIPLPAEHPADAGGDGGDGIGVNLGHDDADLADLLGAQHLGVGVGPVAQLFNDRPDELFFLLAQAAAVEVTGNCGVGHPRHFRNFIDGDRQCIFPLCQASYFDLFYHKNTGL